MFYHESKVILIRWQANYSSGNAKNGNPNGKDGNNSNSKQKKKFSLTPSTLSLKAAVILTIFECNPKSQNFITKQYSHRLDLKEFEVIS